MKSGDNLPATEVIRTRIAPTPSGFLHLGNVLSFVLTTALAERMNARVFLRIDDLDRPRANPEYVRDIFETLEFLDIPWNEGPSGIGEYEREYSQARRMDLYRDALRGLQESGQLFACACSRAEIRRERADGGYPGTCRELGIPPDRKNISWRLRTRPGAPLRIRTLANGTVTAELPGVMRDFVVRRKDGLPAYQLASLMDDLHYGINLVVRGEDLWDSTLAQLELASALGDTTFAGTVFHHHPLLTGPGGQKLSKSAGATSVRYLREQGKGPGAVYSAIGSLLRLKEPVDSRESLAAVLLPG